MQLLFFDGFPWFTTLFGLAIHGVYYQFLKEYPFVDFVSPMFIGTCGTLPLLSILAFSFQNLRTLRLLCWNAIGLA